MKKGYTHIAVVMDRSGSMGSILDSTIEGFNTFLSEQQKVVGKATLTYAQFDSDYEIVYRNVDIKDVPNLNRGTFVPRGLTALNDAICRTIDTVGEDLQVLKESQRPEKIIFVIVTDGGENDSKIFSAEQAKEKISHQSSKYNWEFVYLGANQDAILTAKSYNIAASNAITYGTNAAGVKGVYTTMTSKMADFRTGAVRSMAYTEDERSEQEAANKI